MRAGRPVVRFTSDGSDADELAYWATHDRLTRLANRDLFRTELVRAMALSQRARDALAVLFIDLDRFKQVNDVFGHEVGDRVLVQVAERIVRVSRPADTVGRFGGDEFVVLCNDIREVGRAWSIAQRIASEIDRPFQVGELELSIGCSIGIALAEDTLAPDELMRRADQAMYRAKSERTEVAAYSGDRAPRRIGSETSECLLTAALAGDVELRYQPIVGLRDRQMLALRASIAWSNAADSSAPAGDLMATVADSSTVRELGRWALERSLCDLATFTRLGLNPDVGVMVSLTAQQALDGGLSDAARQAIERASIEPGRLILGVAESILSDVLDPSNRQRFAPVGNRFAIESFGVSGSSLLQLGDLGAAYLTIDQRFVSGLSRTPHLAKVIGAMTQLAGAFGMKAIAAGAESEADLASLRRLGCAAAYGHCVSPALPADQINGLVASGAA